jgi:hypothetical protein
VSALARWLGVKPLRALKLKWPPNGRVAAEADFDCPYVSGVKALTPRKYFIPMPVSASPSFHDTGHSPVIENFRFSSDGFLFNGHCRPGVHGQNPTN